MSRMHFSDPERVQAFARLVKHNPCDVVIRCAPGGQTYSVWHVLSRSDSGQILCYDTLYSGIPTEEEACMQRRNALYYAALQREERMLA